MGTNSVSHERSRAYWEAKKGQMDMEHTPGETLQTLLKEIVDQSREVIDRVKKLLAG
jgi:hypothetical protein